MNRDKRGGARWRWRGPTALAVSAVAVAAGTAVGAHPASAATVNTNAWYVLVNRNSGKALDVYNLATNDGARITQWARNNGAGQQWQFVDSDGGYYRLRSRHSGKVLDVLDYSTADRAQIVQWADHNGTNQQFRLADSDSGYVRLINRNSGKAVDVLGYSTADGAEIIQYTDLNGANQQWQLIPVDGAQPPSGTPPAQYPAPGRVTGDIGVHDPSVVKRPSGGYLMVHTGNDVAIKTSSDRTDWRNAGAAFPGGASWTFPYTNGSRNLWAGDISFHNGQYWLYYSASSFGSNHSAIFLATSPSGASGSWTNRGLVIESATSDNFNAIDPNLVVDDQGRWWLSFGSFWSGIKLVQINPSNGLRLDGTIRGIAGRGGGAIEAPYIFKHGSYYYLWVSWDLCCRGASSTYRIMVGRSTNITGPYLDRTGRDMNASGGTQVLAGHDDIRGPGHEAVLADVDGDVLFYHYYRASDGAALLGINRIGYDSAGWPFVF